VSGMAQVLFRIEVRGKEVLDRVKPPYLICPNHQSYLDPFLVCSTYSRRVLENTFQVGNDHQHYWKLHQLGQAHTEAWNENSIRIGPRTNPALKTSAK